MASPERSLDLPPVYFVVALALMALLDYVVPVFPLVVKPYRYAGIAVMALALALGLWASALFRLAGTAVIPFRPASALVTRGPYRFTRNPMYLGLTGILLGAAILMGSLTPFIVIPGFMALIAERFIAREEAMLEQAFGVAYLDYKARVRRWL
ncbi:MAG TPA: isoprenylcysteine carboxylmethyltransferase family protein [Burkholderiales bacterium]|nr:isoprenylcysteine carboxylmethyltransferase family protein [Burkholderiales bacterium]